jgi:uncharacterized cupredoxin-like copper-binding protein
MSSGSPEMTMSAAPVDTRPVSRTIGCHVPGHYAAGMRGTITIT